MRIFILMMIPTMMLIMLIGCNDSKSNETITYEEVKIETDEEIIIYSCENNFSNINTKVRAEQANAYLDKELTKFFDELDNIIDNLEENESKAVYWYDRLLAIKKYFNLQSHIDDVYDKISTEYGCLYVDSVDKEPLSVFKRGLYLKLPLTQPTYHWVFTDRDSFFKKSSLTLEIYKSDKMKERKYVFHIIENSKFSKEWEALDDEEYKNSNKLYFGFRSKNQIEVTSTDYLKLTLILDEDMEGIGSDFTGILPKGKYVAFGKFSIYDEYKYDAGEDKSAYLSKEDYLSKTWDLNITSHDGWSK